MSASYMRVFGPLTVTSGDSGAIVPDGSLPPFALICASVATGSPAGL